MTLHILTSKFELSHTPDYTRDYVGARDCFQKGDYVFLVICSLPHCSLSHRGNVLLKINFALAIFVEEVAE